MFRDSIRRTGWVRLSHDTPRSWAVSWVFIDRESADANLVHFLWSGEIKERDKLVHDCELWEWMIANEGEKAEKEC